MEKEIKIRDLKSQIKKAQENADPVEKDYLWRLEMTVKTCPPEFLRLAKMSKHVEGMNRSHPMNFPNKERIAV